MALNKYRKLRLQEFNDFDIERLLKKSIDSLIDENESRLTFIDVNQDILDKDIIKDFGEIVENNAAEIVRVTSVLTHTDDVYSYFTGGPLFRKDRDAT